MAEGALPCAKSERKASQVDSEGSDGAADTRGHSPGSPQEVEVTAPSKADAACGTEVVDGGESVVHASGSNPTSDEDQVVVDERKQKRMLSNRESARRSRLRKQQHLDELQGQIAQLRMENSLMLSKYNTASHQYVQITEENRNLRNRATGLAHQLQRLHHAASAQHPGGLAAFGVNMRPSPDFYGYMRPQEMYSGGMGLGPADMALPPHMSSYAMQPMGQMPFHPPQMGRVRTAQQSGVN